MEYLFHVCVLICIYSALAKSLDLVVGQTGILSVAHASFFGVGAYTSSLLVMSQTTTWPVALIIAIVLGVIVSVPIALPSVRLTGDYFVLTTFAFQMLFVSVLNNWTGLTHGPLGIAAIPPIELLGIKLDSAKKMLALALICTALVFLVVEKIRLSPFGRLLHAIREDEQLTRSCGRAISAPKLKVFGIAAGAAAAMGALYAHYLGYIDPTSFTVMDSILIMAMVIIGGPDSRWGPVIGAIALVSLPEILRFVGVPFEAAAKIRELAYGILLVVVVLLRNSKATRPTPNLQSLSIERSND